MIRLIVAATMLSVVVGVVRSSHFRATAMLYIVVLVFAAAPPPANAQVLFPALDQSVEGHPGVTYFDLVRLIAPGARRDNGVYRAEKAVPLRHIGETSQEEDTPSGFAFDRVAVLPVRSGGQERLALLLDIGRASMRAEGFAILALIDPAGQGRLLDAANVAYDIDTAFFEPARLTRAIGDTIVTVSRHSNSNQGYQTTAIVAVREDRLALIDTVFTFSDHACGFERSQHPGIAMVDDGSSPSIRVTVTEEVRLTEPRCDGEASPAAGRRVVSVTYRWNATTGNYIRDSGALDDLAKETQERF